MIDNFQNCLPFTLREEGGNSDDPQDHGGRTSRGITQREYDAFRHLKSLTPADVFNAPDEEIREIYETQYWKPYCDILPKGLDLEFFDFNVNAGRQQAVKDLQRALGVTADGMFGLRTKSAVEQCQNIGKLIHDYANRRRAFYRALRQYRDFGRGWMNRAARIERAAITMSGAIATSAPSSPRANPQDRSKPPISPEAGGATTTISTVLASIMDQIQEFLQKFSSLGIDLSAVKYILVAVAVIALGFTIYGMIHRKNVNEAIG